MEGFAAWSCFMALLVALAVVQIGVKKLSEESKEITMNKSKMAVPAVVAMLETGWAIGASCAANAVPA